MKSRPSTRLRKVGNAAGARKTANNGKAKRAVGTGRGKASRYARVGTKQPVVN